MSEVTYTELDKIDEDIVRLTERVRMSETTTTISQFTRGKITLKKAISKIYLENNF